jgi:hypothetical protein
MARLSEGVKRESMAQIEDHCVPELCTKNALLNQGSNLVHIS